MTTDSIIKTLLANRGLTTKKSIADFLNPPHPSTLSAPFSSTAAITLITKHIKLGHTIAIYGDYDVDGICSTAILWETLYAGYKNVFPHIPHRQSEGYGITAAGIDHCLSKSAKLIITVDNGITAHTQIDYCRSKGCDIIVIDHHETNGQLPNANCILHSVSTCAAALTWFFCGEYKKVLVVPPLESKRGSSLPAGRQGGVLLPDTGGEVALDLVALAVICDIIPLIGINRSFAKYGLEELNHTTRPGLLALFDVAGIKPSPSLKLREGLGESYESGGGITSYHVGFIIGPRLNAMGRLEHAIDSLRLLCTTDPTRAADLAATLNETNRTRQDLTTRSVEHAITSIDPSHLPDLLVVSDPTYDQGIIGLIAAKLVEKFHHPAIAISVGESQSKGSARSIPGFHITDHLRTASHLLTGVGGHSMAAGLSLDTAKLQDFKDFLATTKIDPKLLVKTSRIDAEIDLDSITMDLYTALKQLEPYGLGNPTPIFFTPNVHPTNIRSMGKSNQHLKFTIGSLEAVYFNAPSPSLELREGLGVSYTLDLNSWNGKQSLQLIIRSIAPSQG
jgi:single-stranded-DNA-specific exonuclease